YCSFRCGIGACSFFFVLVLSSLLYLSTVRMDDMGLAVSRSSLERLEFDNVALKKLLLDTSEEPGPRRLEGACFSRVKPKPVVRHRFVAVSNERREVMPGSEPAAHCYCGHQFGSFAGQLRYGAACYLGEVKNPYIRQADGHKAQRSSIREFLCSEAVFALGVPTTRAGSLVTAMWYETCTTEGTPLKRGALLPSASHPPLSGYQYILSLGHCIRFKNKVLVDRFPVLTKLHEQYGNVSL
uniref:Selenoprotein O n=1 Tax=Oncorhynchus tshawytscha TaxID=74940 RepID=A0AAZ3P9X7_ONCTS